MSSPEGKVVFPNEWKKSCIYVVITMGSGKFLVLDPFSYICPLMGIVLLMETLSFCFQKNLILSGT